MKVNPLFYTEAYFTNYNMMGCGGGNPDPTAVAEEQQTNQFDQQLMSLFQSQYSTQQAQLQYLQNKMEPMINNPTGYTQAQLTNLRTEATDTNSQQFQNAEDALNTQISDNSGGSKLTGVAGANVEARAALLNSEAQTQASSQEGITEANANLQQQNYWNAINALNGVAAQENPLGYASASSQAGGTVANLTDANANYIKATSSPLMSVLGGAISGLGSAAINKWCWIAASFYGWHSLKTWVIRMWLLTDAPVWFRDFYGVYGQRIAKTPLRWLFRPIFEYQLYRVMAVA